MTNDGPLAGLTVVTTREMPGGLDRRLSNLGAHVVQVPMIAVVDLDVDPVEGALDWIVVTSRHGASRIGDITGADIGHPLLAAVGTASARVLAVAMDRDVDLVPDPQTGEALAAALTERVAVGSRVLVALASAQILALSVADLVGGGSHDVRHLAAFTLAYGLLLASVAFRPARARTALPVSALLGATLVITAVVDLLAGRIPLAGEVLHLPEVVSVVAVASLAGAFDRAIRSRRRGAARRGSPVAPVPSRRD